MMYAVKHDGPSIWDAGAPEWKGRRSKKLFVADCGEFQVGAALYPDRRAALRAAAYYDPKINARLVKVTFHRKPKTPLGEFARHAFLRAGGGWHNHTCVQGSGVAAKDGDAIWGDFAAEFEAEVLRRAAMTPREWFRRLEL